MTEPPLPPADDITQRTERWCDQIKVDKVEKVENRSVRHAPVSVCKPLYEGVPIQSVPVQTKDNTKLMTLMAVSLSKPEIQEQSTGVLLTTVR